MPLAPRRSQRHSPRFEARTLARVGLVCPACAASVVIGGGAGAFWLCVPAALLLTARAASACATALVASLAVAAAAAPALISASLGPLPPMPLVVFVVAASVAVLHAVRARVEGEREVLRASAMSDPLTGTANRRALGDLIEYEVSRHGRQRRSFAVVMLDLDGFKLVNDRFGHPAGDELLRDVAHALRGAVRDQDTVARLGGDEFCLLAPETDLDGARRLVARVEEAISRVTAGLETLSASIGFALFPTDGQEAASVLQAADAAQADAKRRLCVGRSRRAA